ncbi:hypothetical protein R5L32_21065, partial [Acinetobacter baumannii]|nr:hypothetical protein [Acinetobacter baumannii]
NLLLQLLDGNPKNIIDYSTTMKSASKILYDQNLSNLLLQLLDGNPKNIIDYSTTMKSASKILYDQNL